MKQSNLLKRSVIIEIIAALLILLFAYTAISKLMTIPIFRNVLSKSPLINGYENFLSIALPAIELVIAALLFFPKTRRWGFYSSAIIMTIFTLYIAYMLVFTPHLPCSCGGVLKDMTWTQHLFFNIFFVIISIIGVRLTRNHEPSGPAPQQHAVAFT